MKFHKIENWSNFFQLENFWGKKNYILSIFFRRKFHEAKSSQENKFSGEAKFFFLPKFSKFNDQEKKELDDNFGSRKNFAQK